MIDNKTIRKVIMLNKMLPSGSPTYENREASGAVANFTTNTVQPFVKCECTIDATESGTDELTLTKTGANLFPFETVSGTTYTEKTISLEASTYTLSLVASGNSSTKMRTIFQYTDNSYGGECLFEKDVREAKTVTLTKPVKALLFYAADTYPASVGFTFEYSDIQVELGSTATTYEPYNAETYTVALEETAYGGKVDVIAGSGQIIDEHGDLVYTLFEPVSISAIEGVNNVWCDTGDIEVTYKYKTGEGGSSTKKYLPIFYDFYGKEKYYDHS